MPENDNAERLLEAYQSAKANDDGRRVPLADLPKAEDSAAAKPAKAGAHAPTVTVTYP